MSEKVVELRKTQEDPVAVAAPKPARSRARLRLVLLVILPLIALAGGLYVYLQSGRYISTDNA
jgi:multidrug resistance efflux pump